MKRVRCPKCDNFITFDETRYEAGQSLVFQCPECGKQFGIRMGVSKLRQTQKLESQQASTSPTSTDAFSESESEETQVGCIVVIENVFHYKQVLPLKMGVNQIGRYQKGNPINTPIETVDPSVDLLHCTITVSHDKKGNLKYVLKDGPSYTGTFVDNEILGDREQRIIHDGQMFTIGATSILLRTTVKNI